MERNYYGTVVVLDGTAEMQRRLVMTVADRVPAGILINHTPELEEPEFFHQLERGKSTLLYMQRYPAGIERGNLIRISVPETFAEIVGRFYREGARRFALYHCSGMAPGAVRERAEGFSEGIRRCQLKVPEERIFLGPAGEAEQEAFFSLFRSCRRPDAVICVSDRSAAHFLAELRRRALDFHVKAAGAEGLFRSDNVTGMGKDTESPVGNRGGRGLVRRGRAAQAGKKRLEHGMSGPGGKVPPGLIS